NIQPARQKEAAAKKSLSRAPQVFRQRSHRAKPAAECLAEQKRHGQKRDQQKHSRRMQRRHTVSKHEVPQVHQPSDRQPALDPSRTLQRSRRTTRLKLTNPEIKDAADPHVEQQKRSLEAAARDLRVVAIGAANEFLLGFGSRFGPRLDRLRKQTKRNFRPNFSMKLR